MKMADAKQKRNEQLKRWIGSETDLEPPVVKRKKTKVKFDDGAVFLAACSSGDTEEVLRLLERGADINYANVDGLTALHQVRVCPPARGRPGLGLAGSDQAGACAAAPSCSRHRRGRPECLSPLPCRRQPCQQGTGAGEPGSLPSPPLRSPAAGPDRAGLGWRRPFVGPRSGVFAEEAACSGG